LPLRLEDDDDDEEEDDDDEEEDDDEEDDDEDDDDDDEEEQQQLFTIADLDKFSLQEIDYLLCLNHLSMVSKSNKTKAQKMKLLCAAQKNHHVQLPAANSVSW